MSVATGIAEPQVAGSTVGHGYHRSSEEPDTGFPAPMLTDPLRGRRVTF